jgi:Rieske Fe-S protein
MGAHDDLPKGEGVLLAEKHTALYRDEGGALHALSSVCTHRGCDVHWNPDDKAWACPCHGSIFGTDGQVLHGPATQPLPPADLPTEG